MRFSEQKLSGVFLIELSPHVDERGFFARAFCEQELAEHGLPTHFPQCNLSRNTLAKTLRGLHFEAPPSQESKLVRCVSGAIWDVVVDLRPGSATRLQWIAAELTAEAGQALFIPPGFAHGFITLADNTDVFYHMGDFFKPGAACGARWNDPLFGIAWPFGPRVISERDASYPDFVALGGRAP
jgi:dTDP-4-dehydrorhamnose 3,5-epimerase